MMKVAIPGQAFEAVRKSTFGAEHPEAWRSALNHFETYSRRAGHLVHVDMNRCELRVLRRHMGEMVNDYDHRTANSLIVAVGRIDDVLVHGE